MDVPANSYESVLVGNLKLHSPLEIKTKQDEYLLLVDKGSYRVYLNKGKDIRKPVNIFDPLAGDETSVNLDLLAGACRTENLEEVVDVASIDPVITRPPKEAIAILFDISSSMGCSFFSETDLNRIGAVKSFFEAFAYRTIAYNFEHVVSLILFDDRIEVKCDFTEAIHDFNRFVASAQPRGSTRLFDCVQVAAKNLLAFRKKYPDCLLRIMALTDGEDNGSSVSVPKLAKMLVQENIIIDSFAVGDNCTGLKELTFACGGKCYLMKTLEESLRLFEEETVLSLRLRKMDPVDKHTSV